MSRVKEYTKKPSDFTLEKLIEVLNTFHGDTVLAGKFLDCSPTSLSSHVYEVPELRSLFLRKVAKVEPSGDEMVRDVRLPLGNTKEGRGAKEVLAQNMKLMTDGLRASGIKEDTIDKLQAFQKLEAHAGALLVSSLDMMHRMMIYSATSLFEQCEQIKKKYLDDPLLSTKEKMGWQRLYNQVSEQQYKAFDRILQGTEVMVKLTEPDKDAAKKKQRTAFSPLTDKKPNGPNQT